jgi:peptidoglycan/xylan/chitin deacetylase (PgdA/CDA1 family)
MKSWPWFQRTSIVAALGALALGLWTPSPVREWSIATVLGIYFILSAIGVFAVRMNYYAPAVCRGKAGRKRIALTFDDGPHSLVTPLLLDLLKERQAQATFFCVGEQAEAHPELIRRIVAEGHTLGNHSYAHHWWTNFLTTRPLAREINRAQTVLRTLSGQSPKYYRSPMGLANPHLAPALTEIGLKLIAWNVRPFDRGESAETIVRRVLGSEGKKIPQADGSIVLLHDGGAASPYLVDAVREIIDRFQAQGYSLVNLDELLNDEAALGKF